MEETKGVTIFKVQQGLLQLALYIIKEVCSGSKSLSDADANFLIEINKLITNS